MADTQIVVKIQVHGANRRFKVPLRDLGANVFPEKVRCDDADDADDAAWTGPRQPGRAA
jgi:hypothetical protein